MIPKDSFKLATLVGGIATSGGEAGVATCVTGAGDNDGIRGGAELVVSNLNQRIILVILILYI